MSDYFIGRGIVYVAQIDTGAPKGFVDLGNCPALVIAPGTRGIRNVTNPEVMGKLLPQASIGRVNITFDELNAHNLAQAFYGGEVTQNAGTASNESVPVYTGKFCPTAHIDISSVTVSGKSEGIHYTVEPSGGLHVISGVGAEGENWTVTYNYGAHNITAAFSKAPELLWVRFNGINVAESSKKVVLDIYKVRFSPVNNVPLIGDFFTALTLNGKILYDETKSDDTTWGRFFRMRLAG